MRAISLLVLAGLSGCFVGDRDGDGIPDADDCAPNSRLNECGDVDDTAAPDTDTYVVDTGDTAQPCKSLTWFRDADGDGFGSALVTTDACEQPDGYVADATDCDDADATSYPDAPERCDGADNDCDGGVDENTSNDWFVDGDGDGFGSGDAIDVICDGASGSLVDNDGDCDDADAEVSPEGIETCNGADDDCDGDTDEDAEDAPSWYADLDGDGYGDEGDSVLSCDAPEQYVADATDCDDGDAGVSPGASEQCNDADDDCDGSTDESAVDAGTWYADSDDDGYGDNAVTEIACDAPEQYVADATDCDDGAASVYPGASETCNETDDDCDGVVDESDARDVATWYADTDGDRYGDASASFSSCSAPVGYVADATDCDDGDAGNFPGNAEVCDGADNDCDGDADNDATDAAVWSTDDDGDGYGDASYGSYEVACDQPDGSVADFSDCDDGDAGVSPSATEVYDDAVDNDCNGTVDDSGVYCCADDDGDGYGDPADCVYEETGTCSDSGDVVGDGDCDDANASVNPGALESPYDTVDADCNGSA